MRGRWSWVVAGWLVLAAVGQVVLFRMVQRFFVETRTGQQLDTISLYGNTIGREHIRGLVDTVLNAMSTLSLVAATVVIGFIALARRRVLLAAMATLLIASANLITQVIKATAVRPEFNLDLERAWTGNSLPSGHTTVAASVMVALVLVLPPRLRGPVALIGGGYAALAGVATVTASWHRPSDAVASYLVVGACAAVVALVLVLAQRDDAADHQPVHRYALVLLLLAGFLLLVLAAAAMALTSQVISTPVEWLGRGRLFVAYAGGAVGVAGVASLMMATVLGSIHRVVPERRGSAPETPTAALAAPLPGG